VRVNGRAVVLVDGLQAAQGGQKDAGGQKPAPGVPLQRQGFLYHGSFSPGRGRLGAGGGRLSGRAGAARIHEGVVWSNRDRRTLLDKLAALLVGLPWDQPVTVVADAYYAAAKFARRLLAQGHHLVSRVRCNGVAYFPASPPKGQRRGRRARYGAKSNSTIGSAMKSSSPRPPARSMGKRA